MIPHIVTDQNQPRTAKPVRTSGAKIAQGLLLTLLVPLLTSCAEDANQEVKVQPQHKEQIEGGGGVTNKYGFINTDGKLVIPLQFDDAESFSDGLARVTINQSTAETRGYNFIDKTGKIVITLADECDRKFAEDVVGFKSSGKWGFIDKRGKTVLKPLWDDVRSFSQGICAVKQGQKWGYINRKGEVVIPPQYTQAREFQNGRALAKFATKDWCVIDLSGKKLNEIGLSHLGKISEGLVDAKFHEPNKCGYVDTNGKAVIRPLYDNSEFFSEGRGAVERDHLWGFVDKTGTLIVQPQYRLAQPYSDGLSAVFTENGMAGFIDHDGKVVIPMKYHDAGAFVNGLAPVNLNDKWGFIDKKGKYLIKPELGFAAPFCEGLAIVAK